MTFFMAAEERFQYIRFNLRIGATTVGKIFGETCRNIWEVLSPMHLMKNTSTDQRKKIADRFEKLWNFPNCCGAIDGKHIRIEAPWNCGSLFFNYKSYHSIILQAFVDGGRGRRIGSIKQTSLSTSLKLQQHE